MVFTHYLDKKAEVGMKSLAVKSLLEKDKVLKSKCLVL